MIKIRRGMFETNSSSTHAIILANKKVEPGLSVDFAIGEFGWEFKKYDSTNAKASYLYTMACECEDRDVYQDFYEILTKYGINCTCSRPPVIGKWGVENGYVDHYYNNDAKTFVQRMMTHEKALIKFLFGNDSFIVTGNDNCDDEEREWWLKQQKVDYKHERFYKGN